MLCKEKNKVKAEYALKDINKLVKDFVELKEITRTMLVSLVDRIEVLEDKEITIYYKFNILNIRKLNDELYINEGAIIENVCAEEIQTRYNNVMYYEKKSQLEIYKKCYHFQKNINI